MTIEQRRHSEILSRLDTLSAAVVALCEAIKSMGKDEAGEEEEAGCEAVRPIRVYVPRDDEIEDVEREGGDG